MGGNLTPWRDQWVVKPGVEHGGQATVAQLRSKTHPKTRAVLKRIIDRWKNDPQARERLRKEAEILSRLHDIGARVPAVYDSFLQHDGAEPFILMEFIPGVRFDEWLKTKAPVSPAEAALITRAIAETIDLCHNHKIGHRDIKPANIILKDGDIANPYVLDFGISFDSRHTIALTKEGEMFWNEFIVLPECQDLGGGHRDLRSDITALVGLFFSCITGKQPILLRDAQENAPHQRHEELITASAGKPELGERLMWFFDKGFAYRIDDRFQTLDEFRAELDYFVDPTSERTLDLMEEFGHLDQMVQRSDRGVQLGLLRRKYNTIRDSVNKSLATRLSGLREKNGALSGHQVSWNDVAEPEKPSSNEGDLLDEGQIPAYYVTRHDYEKIACVLFVAFGVGMDIHLYAASATGPRNNIKKFDSPLKWSRIAVIDEIQDELNDSKLTVIVEALQSRLAGEVRKLTSRA